MPRGFPVKKMREIQEKIHSLDDDNQRTILQILRDDNVMYSENTNGVFFDIMSVSRGTLDKITKFLEFCDNCTSYLDKRDKDQMDMKKDITDYETNARE